MKSFFNYLSARSRLKEINKTIDVMGIDDSPPILLAQRDFTFDEVTFFYYKMIAEFIYSLVFIILLIVSYGVYDAI